MLNNAIQKKNFISYILILIWLVIMYLVESIFIKLLLGGILVIISIYFSYTYYKQLSNIKDKKNYLAQKIIIIVGLVVASIVTLYIIK